MALKKHWIVIAIVAIAIGIAWAFCAVTLRHTRPMGFPLDDSYIYLTYAKQFGRGQPFTYFPGGGYSAGSTSVLWPMVLAPFWTLGARGHALVWVSYLMCAGLYAATVAGVYRLAKTIAGELAGICAALVALAFAAFAFTALSGMEVAFASALLVWTMQLLIAAEPTGKPSNKLIACLAAASLSRPEAMMLVGMIVGIAVLQRLRQRDLRSALWWASPLAAPLAWLVANKLFAGQLFPNTGVAKSHFYLPGFDWPYWFDAVKTQTGKMFVGLFWDGASPLVAPKLVLAAWLIGCVRVALWGRRAQRRLAAAAIIVAPFVLIFAVIASSGLWKIQNYRYIAPAMPIIAIGVGVALAPLRWTKIWWGAALAIVATIVYRAIPLMRADMNLFAQGAMDTNTQVVAIGEYLHAKKPDAHVMFHDAGAVAYYGDTNVYDMLGLVTNYQAGVANNGPGSRFEFLESLPPDKRPDLFAYYPAWMGTNEFYGDVLMRTPWRPGFDPRRLVGDSDMQVIEARWDHVGTAERPLGDYPGWTMVDRVDVADLASERAHGYRAELGRRHLGDPTATWSFVARVIGDAGLQLDGGRTIRGGRETFSIDANGAEPVKLVIRGGGDASYPFQDSITKPVTLDVNGVAAVLPMPSGRFVDVVVDLPAGTHDVTITAPKPYRSFHYFVLQAGKIGAK